MSEELLERARRVVEGVQRRGAQGVRVAVWRNREGRSEWRDGKLDRLRESTQMGLSATLYVDGRYSSNNTSDLRPAALERFLDEVVGATRMLAQDPHRKLPDPGRYADRFAGDLELFDQAGAQAISGAERRRKAAALEQAARSSGDAAEIISVTATCSEYASEAGIINSNGMEGSRRGTSFWLSARTSVRDEGDRKPSGGWSAGTRTRSKLPSIESVGREATARALRERGAKPEKSGEYPCIIENRVVGRLLRGLLGPLGGRAIQQKRSFLADKKGQQIASKVLTITDDPLVVEGFGSRTYDGEGMSAARRPLFAEGVLQTFFLSTYYASKLGLEPTTGGSSNLSFVPGTRSLDELCAEMGKGILVTGFSGGNSNSATGDFSIGIRGQWIEGGKVARPVAEMNLSGNHLKLWHKLAELGADPFPYSSTRAPSLRFEPVQFSGV